MEQVVVPNLGKIFRKDAITNPMDLFIIGPMLVNEGDKLMGRSLIWRQTGEAINSFSGGRIAFLDFPMGNQLKHLLNTRSVEIIIQGKNCL